MGDETGLVFRCKLMRCCRALACSICLAATAMVGPGDIGAEAKESRFSTGPIRLADDRRPGITSDARRPGLERGFPETERDRQRPGYRPGYRPGAFERRAPRDCLQDQRSGSRQCR